MSTQRVRVPSQAPERRVAGHELGEIRATGQKAKAKQAWQAVLKLTSGSNHSPKVLARSTHETMRKTGEQALKDLESKE